MKRIYTLLLTLIMGITCCFGTASATEVKASITLASYVATMKAGSGSGDLTITYKVDANMVATQIGVSSIDIYKSNGAYVTTITGGMATSNSNVGRGSYTYSGVSGVSYYAVVTVFATSGSITDSRTVTTSTVKAP